MRKGKSGERKWVDYYERADILEELLEEPVEFSINGQLRKDIVLKRRKRKLQNVTIKIDPLQILAIRKLATIKSIPYQTLIRHWLSKEIKKELNPTP